MVDSVAADLSVIKPGARLAFGVFIEQFGDIHGGVLGQATPPAWRFASLTLGAMHSCGLTDEGAAVCWGLDIDGQSLPPGLSFTALSAGGWHTCGLTSDASIVCWGRDDRGQAPSVP